MRLKQFTKAARIPIRVRNGQIEFLYDNQLPPLKDGDWGELVVDINTVEDPAWQKFLVEPMPVLTADVGDFVAFRVATDKGADVLKEHLISNRESAQLRGATKPQGSETEAFFGDGFGVLGQLTTPLTINLRGENLSKFSGGAVDIRALSELKLPHQAISLNQALTRISRVFEPKRQGNNGDAFRDVYLLTEKGWSLLDNIRKDFESQHEDERWQEIGLDPQKVRGRMLNDGGIFPDESTKK